MKELLIKPALRLQSLVSKGLAMVPFKGLTHPGRFSHAVTGLRLKIRFPAGKPSNSSNSLSGHVHSNSESL